MKVRINSIYDDREQILDLKEALRPNAHSNIGTIEELETKVEQLEETVGILMALLVEKDVLSLDEAAKACNIYSSTLELVE